MICLNTDGKEPEKERMNIQVREGTPEHPGHEKPR